MHLSKNESINTPKTLREGLSVRKSTIPSAGSGLFCDAGMREGQCISVYAGEYVTYEEHNRRYQKALRCGEDLSRYDYFVGGDIGING